MIEVLYIGQVEHASTLQHFTPEWNIHSKVEMMDALSHYIFGYPHIIIIEDGHEEAYAHLRSVNAKNIIILTDEPTAWDTDHYALTLPFKTDVHTLIAHIHHQMDDNTTPVRD